MEDIGDRLLIDAAAAVGRLPGMPRANRGDEAGMVYHAVNRGNARQRVFHDPADYRAFLDLLAPACERHPLRVLAACLMPNHVHLVLWPREAGQAGRFMQWLFTSHVRRHHRRYPGRGGGHVWQGRFKSFPVQAEPDALHAVVRYVERNPLRAGLVESAGGWPWGSLPSRRPGAPRPAWLAAWPEDAPEPGDWAALVDAPQTEAELAALRRSVARGSPYGGDAWRAAAAARLNLASTLRPRGRPGRTTGGDAGQMTLVM